MSCRRSRRPVRAAAAPPRPLRSVTPTLSVACRRRPRHTRPVGRRERNKVSCVCPVLRRTGTKNRHGAMRRGEGREGKREGRPRRGEGARGAAVARPVGEGEPPSGGSMSAGALAVALPAPHGHAEPSRSTADGCTLLPRPRARTAARRVPRAGRSAAARECTPGRGARRPVKIIGRLEAAVGAGSRNAIARDARAAVAARARVCALGSRAASRRRRREQTTVARWSRQHGVLTLAHAGSGGRPGLPRARGRNVARSRGGPQRRTCARGVAALATSAPRARPGKTSP